MKLWSIDGVVKYILFLLKLDFRTLAVSSHVSFFLDLAKQEQCHFFVNEIAFCILMIFDSDKILLRISQFNRKKSKFNKNITKQRYLKCLRNCHNF